MFDRKGGRCRRSGEGLTVRLNKFLPLALAAYLLSFGAPAPSFAQGGAAFDLSKPEGVLAAQRRLWCTEADGEPVYWTFTGEAFSRRQGEKDQLLFKVYGYNVRTCGKINDPQKGAGFRSVSRELLIYADPKTGKPLSKWANPWSGETVDVLHVANDPVSGDFFLKGRDGQPIKWTAQTLGDQWLQTSTIPLFYPNPLGGEYQPEVGGTYHATEMFNFMGDLKSLTEPGFKTAGVNVGWVRISDWLPWMKMGGREGMIYFHTAGRKMMSFDDMPQAIKEEVATYYPLYRNPPPPDDRRPNVTSWSYFKSVREGKEKAPVRK
jgi:hypothetical protein